MSQTGTFDTIGLYKDYSNLENILKDSVINNKLDYFKETVVKPKNFIEYSLIDDFKNSIFNYGIECVKLFKSKKTNNAFRFCIQFNAKLLGNDYLKGISKININIVLSKVLRTIEPYFKIKFDDFRFFNVGLVDYTKNIILNNSYNVSDVLDSIKHYSSTDRATKSINDKFIEKGTLTYHLSNKEKLIIYDKNRELNKKDNKEFVNKNKSLLEKSKNMLRVETRIKGKKRIKKEFELFDNNELENINIFDVLDSNINIAYKRVCNITKGLRENKVFNKIDSIDSLSYKDKKDIFEAIGLNQAYNNDIEAIREAIQKDSKSRQTFYNRFKKYLRAKRVLDSLNSNTKKVDYRELLECVLNSLKVA